MVTWGRLLPVNLSGGLALKNLLFACAYDSKETALLSCQRVIKCDTCTDASSACNVVSCSSQQTWRMQCTRVQCTAWNTTKSPKAL